MHTKDFHIVFTLSLVESFAGIIIMPYYKIDFASSAVAERASLHCKIELISHTCIHDLIKTFD